MRQREGREEEEKEEERKERKGYLEKKRKKNNEREGGTNSGWCSAVLELSHRRKLIYSDVYYNFSAPLGASMHFV